MARKSNKQMGLQDAIKHFSEPANVLAYMTRLRWPDGVVTCPTCGREDAPFLKNQNKWQCKSVHPKRQFSAKVGTIFEDSPIPMDKWLVAVWMLSDCRNGVSSYELARAIGVTQKSAWFMLHRIRKAMQTGSISKLGGGGGEVESDETFVGGKTRNMHKTRRMKIRAAAGVPVYPCESPYAGKTAVIGILDRDARTIRAQVLPNMKRETLQNQILNNVEHGAKLYTDSAIGYDKLADRYAHEVVNHTTEYVRGRVHTNGLENFWSLLKRSLHGTYVAVEPFHLDRYVDEQVFRFNNRGSKEHKVSDFARFTRAMSQVAGKRLTFAEVTGKVGETAF